MRVLVCGGRSLTDQALVNRTLESVYLDTPIAALIEGGALGADRLARRWAYSRRLVQIDTYNADWQAHGRAAGPIRNQRMIDEGRPDLVIAFPGGRGTADMIRRAKAAGIEVREVTPSPAELGEP